MDAVLDFKRAGLGDSPVPKRPVSRADMGAEVIFRRVPPSLLKWQRLLLVLHIQWPGWGCGTAPISDPGLPEGRLRSRPYRAHDAKRGTVCTSPPRGAEPPLHAEPSASGVATGRAPLRVCPAHADSA